MVCLLMLRCGGRLSEFTVGLSWHLTSHCRMMLDGIHARIANTGSSLIATLRIQIDC